MTIKSRQDATAEFRSNPSVKIMVATLKTAGEGLNLEFANRVISTYDFCRCNIEIQHTDNFTVTCGGTLARMLSSILLI